MCNLHVCITKNYLSVYIYTVMAKNISTLGIYVQRMLGKMYPFDLKFFLSQKSNLSLDNKNLKWGEISL